MHRKEKYRSTTTNIGLYKHDNVSTNTNPFNITKALNENWDIIDEVIGDIQISHGKSAYEIAVEKGFNGTEEQWLISLKGKDGKDGVNGSKGDKGDTGLQGAKGDNGQDGYTPVKGTDYFTESEITEITNTITTNVNNNIGIALDEINGEVV